MPKPPPTSRAWRRMLLGRHAGDRRRSSAASSTCPASWRRRRSCRSPRRRRPRTPWAPSACPRRASTSSVRRVTCAALGERLGGAPPRRRTRSRRRGCPARRRAAAARPPRALARASTTAGSSSIFDLDRLGRVLRRGRRARHDQRDSCADVAHALARQDVGRCGTLIAPPRPGYFTCGGGVLKCFMSSPVKIATTPGIASQAFVFDGDDPGMRAVGAQEVRRRAAREGSSRRCSGPGR